MAVVALTSVDPRNARRYREVLESLGVEVRLLLSTDAGTRPTEELMEGEEGDVVSHERYSAGIVKHVLREVIEDHPVNTANYRIRAEEVTGLLAGEPAPGH